MKKKLLKLSGVLELKKKGIDKERDLINFLEYHNLKAIRTAGSGGGTNKDRPDIIAGDINKNIVYCIELKSTSKDFIYINQKQVKGLINFTNNFLLNAVPVIAIKFNYMPYYFLSIHDLKSTKKGNYRIIKQDLNGFKNRLVIPDT